MSRLNPTNEGAVSDIFMRRNDPLLAEFKGNFRMTVLKAIQIAFEMKDIMNTDEVSVEVNGSYRFHFIYDTKNTPAARLLEAAKEHPDHDGEKQPLLEESQVDLLGEKEQIRVFTEGQESRINKLSVTKEKLQVARNNFQKSMEELNKQLIIVKKEMWAQ